MVHPRQELLLGGERLDRPRIVRLAPDDLEGHLALQRLDLLGPPHRPEPSLAETLDQAIATDVQPGLPILTGRLRQEASGALECREERLHFVAEGLVVAAGSRHERAAPRGWSFEGA